MLDDHQSEYEIELSHTHLQAHFTPTQSEHVVTATVLSVWEHIHWLSAANKHRLWEKKKERKNTLCPIGVNRKRTNCNFSVIPESLKLEFEGAGKSSCDISCCISEVVRQQGPRVLRLAGLEREQLGNVNVLLLSDPLLNQILWHLFLLTTTSISLQVCLKGETQNVWFRCH